MFYLLGIQRRGFSHHLNKKETPSQSSSQEAKIMLVGKSSTWTAFQKFNCFKILLVEGDNMSVARAPWALVVMQITCYTTHIGGKKKKKTKQKHNFGRRKMKTTKNSHYQPYSYVVHGNKISLRHIRHF